MKDAGMVAIDGGIRTPMLGETCELSVPDGSGDVSVHQKSAETDEEDWNCSWKNEIRVTKNRTR